MARPPVFSRGSTLAPLGMVRMGRMGRMLCGVGMTAITAASLTIAATGAAEPTRPLASADPRATSPTRVGPSTARPFVDPMQHKTSVIDRIAARIDQDIVLLSDVKRRCLPMQAQLVTAAPQPGPVRTALEDRLMRDMLDKMINERLTEREAGRLQINVTEAEIDQSLLSVAISQHVSSAELIKLVEGMHFSEAQYRDDLRHQLIENKLINLRLAGRAKTFSSLTAEQAQQKMLVERELMIEQLRKRAFVEVRL